MSLFDVIIGICKEKDISINKLEHESGVTRGSIGKWNKSTPSIDNVKKVADYFGMSIDELIGRTNEDGYYINPEVAKVTQELKDRPEMKVLFDAAKNASKEDINFVVEMLNKMKK